MGEKRSLGIEGLYSKFWLKLFVIITSFFIVFHRDIFLLGNEVLNNDLLSYVLAVPFLFAFLVYRKRNAIRESLESNLVHRTLIFHKLIGFLLCLIAFFLVWYGTGSLTPLRYHVLAIPIFLAGSILLLFHGLVLKIVAIPIAFLLFLVPPPLLYVHELATYLSSFGVQFASAILNFLGQQANYIFQEGVYTMVLFSAKGGPLTLEVGFACSGVFSLMGFAVFAVFVSISSGENLWKKLAFLFVSFPFLYLLNVFRIVITGLMGSAYGEGAAMTTFHSLGGFVLIFFGVLFMMILFEGVLDVPIFSRIADRSGGESGHEKIDSPNRNSEKSTGLESIGFEEIGGIIVLLSIASLSIFVYAPVFSVAEGPEEITHDLSEGFPKAEKVFPQLEGYNLEYSYRSDQFETRSGQLASLVYFYAPENDSGNRIWAALEVDDSRYSLHSWEVCASVSGWTILSRKEVQLVGHPSITAKELYIDRTDFDDRQSVLYWIKRVPFGIEGDGMKYVKVNLVAWTDDPDWAAERLKSIGREITFYWKSKAGGKFALVLSSISAPMILLLSGGVIISLMYLSYNRYKRLSQKST